MKKLFIIHVDGSIDVISQEKAPDLTQLQKAVGGFIERVPHFNKFEHKGVTYLRGTAYANEYGSTQLPFNTKATKAWRDCLGDGPFWYEPRLFGSIIFVASEATMCRTKSGKLRYHDSFKVEGRENG